MSDSSDSDDVTQKKTITVDSAPEVQQPEASSVRRSPLRRYSQEDREAARASRDLDTPEVTAELGDSTLQPLVMTSRGVAQAGGKLAKAMKHLAEEERLRAERSVEQLQLMSSALVKPSTTQLPATQTVESMGKESLAAPPARDSKEAEVVMPPPPQPQTLPPITSFLPQQPRAPSSSSDVILDLHTWERSEFDSADEEGGRRSETSSILSETTTEVNVATGRSTQVTDSAQTGAKVSARSSERFGASENRDLGDMNEKELIEFWNAVRHPSEELLFKILTALPNQMSEFAMFLQREGQKMSAVEFRKKMAKNTTGVLAAVKVEEYEKRCFIPSEEQDTTVIDVEEHEEGELIETSPPRPASSTTMMEQAAQERGDTDLRVEQMRAAKGGPKK